ncbi:MAG TPA: Ig-like domain-containing protein [Longimicrobium sp.]|nr:Ig-like domain-containing protein [Longimicrobium sp.]
MMFPIRPVRALALLAILSACADDPTGTPPPEPEPGPRVEGVYQITLTGLGGPEVQGSAAPVPTPGGASLSLSLVNTGLALELVSSGTFTDGPRGQGGHRYVSATYRVRNGTGAPLANLTFLPATSSATIAGTPFTALTLYNGGAANSALASQAVPTGAVTLGAGTALRAPDPDVLQVFQESEVAAIPLPAGITGVFPYGFVVRNPNSATTRTLPPAAGAGDYAGLVTFAFRVPLSPSGASQDPFTISFHVLAVQDTETRLTESMEEAQDSAAVRRLRDRAASLGATTVTVLAGSGAAGPDVPDYPGQRQICAFRTAGTAGAPVTHNTNPAAYARLLLLRPGETPSACGASFRGGTPAVATVGSPYALALRAVDRYGNLRTSVADSVRLERIAGPAATFGPAAALAGGEASIVATYGGNGNSVLRASGARIQGQEQVDVGAPGVVLHAGNRQAGMAGTTLATRPAVLVRDAAGKPIAGRPVAFSVTGGGGKVTSAVVTTDAFGVATVGSWTLGSTADFNTLTATVGGTGVAGNPVQFTAAGCQGGGSAQYDITLCYNSTVTASQRAAFQAAVTRWQGLVTGDLPAVNVNQAAGFCNANTPGLGMAVDDLLIFAAVTPIDGAGGTLGSAGPCWLRQTGSLSIVGSMRFDAADVANLEASGRFGAVILHEMGHVLGIGTLWAPLGLLQNPSPPGGPPLDTWFSGAGGLLGFNNIGGSTYTGGQKVPVENTGSAGTMNAHWRESVLDNELMTGYLDVGSNPLSQLSVRSLADMGYTVNVAGADFFFLTLTARGEPDSREGGILLLNDVDDGPIHRQDERGRVTRVR